MAVTTEAGYRSKCAACGETICEGDEIAQDVDENWVHSDCVDPREIRFNMAKEARDE